MPFFHPNSGKRAIALAKYHLSYILLEGTGSVPRVLTPTRPAGRRPRGQVCTCLPVATAQDQSLHSPWTRLSWGTIFHHVGGEGLLSGAPSLS